MAVLFFVPTVHAQELKLAGTIVQAIKDANDTIADLDKLQTALADFQLGRSPNTSGDWSRLGDRFQSAAKAIRQTPLPDLGLAETPLIYPKTDCHNDLLDRSQAYLRHLQQTQNDGAASLQSLDDQLARVAKARDTIRQIADLYKKASAIPEFGSKFALDWVDLETSVPAGLAEYRSALQERRKSIAQQMDGLSARIANLQSNLALMQKPCDEDEARRKAQEEEARRKAQEEALERQRIADQRQQAADTLRASCVSGNFHEGTTYRAGQLYWILTFFNDGSASGRRSDNACAVSLHFASTGWSGSLSCQGRTTYNIVLTPNGNCSLLSSNLSWFRLMRF